jgi:chloramphenicol-sensitive protein RarD
MNTGILYATAAFLCWGLFPLYFHAIGEVPPMEILAHRMLWSLAFLVIVLTARQQWKWLPRCCSSRACCQLCRQRAAADGQLGRLHLVGQQRPRDRRQPGLLHQSAGERAAGLIVLKEKLRRAQWIAISVAAGGVAWLTWQAGQLPWIALILGITFGGYGLLRKTAALAALEGLSLETMILFPLALIYVLWLGFHGQNTFINTPHDSTRWLLAAAGPITAIRCCCLRPARARSRWRCWACCNICRRPCRPCWACGCSMKPSRPTALGFLIIWAALILYVAEGLWAEQTR